MKYFKFLYVLAFFFNILSIKIIFLCFLQMFNIHLSNYKSFFFRIANKYQFSLSLAGKMSLCNEKSENGSRLDSPFSAIRANSGELYPKDPSRLANN